LDIAHANSLTIGSKLTVSATVAAFVIHYLRQINGGTFRYRVDGGAWTNVDTSNGSSAFGSQSVNLTTGAHTLEIEVLTAGTAGITLMGVDCQGASNGVRLHKIGNSGATAAQYVAVNASIWQDGLSALNPHAVGILLGTNDMSASIVPSIFAGQIQSLCSRIRAAVPLCDIFLIVPGPNGLTGRTYTIAEYGAALYDLATSQKFGWCDLERTAGAYADAEARGLYVSTDNVHPTATGGYVYGDFIAKFLKGSL
jgi:lysophospholipase L1-like esterase